VLVRYVETDMQGHVFFGNYFTYFDVSLIEYLKTVGYNYNDFLGDGVDFFYIHADCQYKGRAFFDETLYVYTKVSNIGNTSFTFEFYISEEKSDRPIASGRIVAVAINRNTHESTRVPERFRKAISDFEEESFIRTGN